MSLAALVFAAPCTTCGRPTGGDGAVFCDACTRRAGPPPTVPAPAGTDGCVALVDYRGVGRDLVIALKFRGRHAVLGRVARRLGTLLADTGVDVITWAPTSRARRRRRGFDQAELLARRLAPVLGVPWCRMLVRAPGAPQTGRDRAERLRGPGFTLHRRARGIADGRRILIVDDVVTTGATMTAAARVLRAAGAVAVRGAAIAHTSDDGGPATAVP